MLCGTLQPTSGVVSLFGKKLTGTDSLRGLVGVCPQVCINPICVVAHTFLFHHHRWLSFHSFSVCLHLLLLPTPFCYPQLHYLSLACCFPLSKWFSLLLKHPRVFCAIQHVNIPLDFPHISSPSHSLSVVSPCISLLLPVALSCLAFCFPDSERLCLSSPSCVDIQDMSLLNLCPMILLLLLFSVILIPVPYSYLQFDVLVPTLTVSEHLRLFCALKDVNPSLVDLQVDQMLTKLNMADRAHALACSLSGGERRRLSIGIALIGDSKLVVLDEPTTGVDPQVSHH